MQSTEGGVAEEGVALPSIASPVYASTSLLVYIGTHTLLDTIIHASLPGQVCRGPMYVARSGPDCPIGKL